MLSHAELARLAGASYRGPWSGRVALDVKYDLLPRGDELVVVLPGTNAADPLDWLRDLCALPRWFKGLGPLHSGFGAGGVATWAEIAPKLPGDKRIVYTGHSLGGAMAQVLAALHVVAGAPPCRLVTFGAPRVPLSPNLGFGHLLRQTDEAVEYWREGDPVPDVPMAPFFIHPTRPRRIGVAVRDPIANHAIARYVADLQAVSL